MKKRNLKVVQVAKIPKVIANYRRFRHEAALQPARLHMTDKHTE